MFKVATYKKKKKLIDINYFEEEDEAVDFYWKKVNTDKYDGVAMWDEDGNEVLSDGE
jgi:hypothetical protein